MIKNQDKIKAGEERKQLEGKRKESFNREYEHFSERKKTVWKRWYVVYLSTTLATVLCVVLLILFGVGSSGRPLRDSIFIGNLADGVAELFAKIDFPIIGQEPSRDPISSAGDDTAPEKDNGINDSNDKPSADVGGNIGSIYDYDYSLVPDGYTPIIPMDLSLFSYGSEYINNATGYTPDVETLLNQALKDNGGYEPLAYSDGPTVLIVHTHGTESYSPDGALYIPEGDEAMNTTDTNKNVVAIGKTVADILNEKGVATAHCTIMHDNLQYKDSYARAEETIRRYLAEYPTIKLVIDIHRDAIVKSSGEIVRPVTQIGDKAAAQLMCVVGSDWESEDKYSDWQKNLSLALKLRELLNSENDKLCRPVFLKSHTYNQEIAPYSLLIEVGSSGNSLEEAKRSAEILAEKISLLINEI